MLNNENIDKLIDRNTARKRKHKWASFRGGVAPRLLRLNQQLVRYAIRTTIS